MTESVRDDARPGAVAKRGLLRILGVGFGLAVIVGSTLGIGILRTPGLVAGQLSSRSSILAVWLVGGLYTLLGSVCLTELGTMLPQAGGYYVYARRAFGDTVGFAVGWSDWITYCAVLGYVTIAMGEFTAALAPSLAPATKRISASLDTPTCCVMPAASSSPTRGTIRVRSSITSATEIFSTRCGTPRFSD